MRRDGLEALQEYYGEVAASQPKRVWARVDLVKAVSPPLLAAVAVYAFLRLCMAPADIAPPTLAPEVRDQLAMLRMFGEPPPAVDGRRERS